MIWKIFLFHCIRNETATSSVVCILEFGLQSPSLIVAKEKGRSAPNTPTLCEKYWARKKGSFSNKV